MSKEHPRSTAQTIKYTRTKFEESIDEKIEKKSRRHTLEFSNDLRDTSACMTNALDCLKFEVLVASQLDPFKSKTKQDIKLVNSEITAKQEARIKKLMADDGQKSISRTFS